MLLESRVALVTGASRGIGAATARALARHGAAVGVNYFESEGAAREVVSAIAADGGKAVALQGDARDASQIWRPWRMARKRLWGRWIHWS